MSSKLAELRSRTNRQLRIVVRRQLDRALALARVASGKDSPLFLQAAQDFEEVKRLLPRIEGLSEADRAEFEAKLKELDVELDAVALKRVRLAS